ncbi:MAG: hypothetical protein U5K43_00640 [Halofilum sp. (in: g-proteobacteria)]|nr:hypothetical protein [Halofilum sp. (in: g-proteobacteria)]
MPQYEASRAGARSARWSASTRPAQGTLLDFIDAFCERFPRLVDEYETLLTDNRIWKQRTGGHRRRCCRSARSQLGFTGPMLRGSGVEWDLRKKQPYEVYDRMDFDVPGRHQRRLLRSLPGAHRGDASVDADHQAVHRSGCAIIPARP